MKKVLFSTLLLGFVILANAQDKGLVFKPFKADFAVGYAIPGGSGSKGGVIAAFEPKYSINNNITLGLRMEAAITARAYMDVNKNYVAGSVKASGSYLATADYFFNTNNFRPFVGVGAGIFNLASVTETDANNATVVVAGGSKFGFMPRAGFEISHFRMALEYNVAGKTGTIDNNYLGIKIGFYIGGGRFK